jgi:DNA primase
MLSADLNRDAAKEQIRGRLDIVDVVGRYVALKPAGQNMKARCPFHNERTPSFMVNPARQIFHCFGCGKGGDVFSFLMEIEGLTFPEALARFSEETGVKLGERSEQPPRPSSVPGISKDAALKIHLLAARYYYGRIRGNETAIGFFKKRGLSSATVRDFMLGYAEPGWDGFVAYAAHKGVSAAACAECGLAVSRPDGTAYDRFRDRIIFPVFDIAGRVIAFGGRAVADGQEPKYLNSPETVLYHKTRTLYGLNRSRQAIKEKGHAVCVEGYMDFLSLYQAGIVNCIATSGTALTEEHGRVIRRFTQRVVLLFDGDEAGMRAAERGVFLLAPLGLDVRVCVLPDGNDPDSFVRAKGAAALTTLMDGAVDGMRYAVDRAQARFGTSTPQGKSGVVKHLLPLIAATSDPIIASEYVKYVSERCGLREQLLYAEIRKMRGTPHPGTGELPADEFERYLNSIEGRIMQLCVRNPGCIERAMERISPDSFTDQFSRNIYSLIVDTYRLDPSLATLMDRVEDGGEKRFLSRVLIQPEHVQNPEEELQYCCSRLDARRLKKRMRVISTRLKEQVDESEKTHLLDELQSIARTLREMNP